MGHLMVSSLGRLASISSAVGKCMAATCLQTASGVTIMWCVQCAESWVRLAFVWANSGCSVLLMGILRWFVGMNSFMGLIELGDD